MDRGCGPSSFHLAGKARGEVGGRAVWDHSEARGARWRQGNRGGAVSATQQPSIHDRERSSGPRNAVAPTDEMACPVPPEPSSPPPNRGVLWPLIWQQRLGQNLLNGYLCLRPARSNRTWSPHGPDVGCLRPRAPCNGKWCSLSRWWQSWRGLVLQKEASEPREGKWLTEVAQYLRHRLGLEPRAPRSPGFDFPGLFLDRRGEGSLSRGRDVKKG